MKLCFILFFVSFVLSVIVEHCDLSSILFCSVLFWSIRSYSISFYSLRDHSPWKSCTYEFEFFRLARNARNFGASYLRLEDYYCYAASALDAVAEIADLSALIPFDAKAVYPWRNLPPIPLSFTHIHTHTHTRQHTHTHAHKPIRTHPLFFSTSSPDRTLLEFSAHMTLSVNQISSCCSRGCMLECTSKRLIFYTEKVSKSNNLIL